METSDRTMEVERRTRTEIIGLAREQGMDVFVFGAGDMLSAVRVFVPITDAGREWIEDNVDADSPDEVPVEMRYADDIVHGMQEDGLVIGGAPWSMVVSE